MAVKRLIDVLVGAFAGVLLLPLVVLIYLMVLVRMGSPVLFRQQRLGYLGEPFDLVKFRTMTNALSPQGELLPDDDRITSLGKVLRSTSLDELPELWNVLRGDLSLVGPRPLPVRYRDRYSLRQRRRHDMPPGMAGPVMAGGRNALSWQEKFDLDVWYVENWSLLLDLRLFLRSVRRLITREGVSPEGRATMEEFTGESSE